MFPVDLAGELKIRLLPHPIEEDGTVLKLGH